MVRTPESEQISSESFGVEAMQSSTDAFATLKKEQIVGKANKNKL
ncbi:18961_t:CDS:2 [Rhizophagus irregularis]|nr:18961_t:CDS:2 [Rhizophagus irregularis]